MNSIDKDQPPVALERAVYREPTLQEVDNLDPDLPLRTAVKNTARDRAKAADKLISALMPGANRAARREALRNLNRSQKARAKGAQ